MGAPEIELLLAAIDQAYDRKSWHGTNLRGSLRGLHAEQAAWRPAPVRHNAWELVVHCAYWKYVVRRRLTGERRGSFPLAGSNWWRRPDGELSEAAWKRDLQLLESAHRALRETVTALAPADLDRVADGAKIPHRDLLTGIAAHDVYHAGQIQLLKRLRSTR